MSQTQEIERIINNLKDEYGENIENLMVEFCNLPENKKLVWKDGFDEISNEELKNYESLEEEYKKLKINPKIMPFEKWANTPGTYLKSKNNGTYIHLTEKVNTLTMIYGDSDGKIWNKFESWCREKKNIELDPTKKSLKEINKSTPEETKEEIEEEQEL